MITHETIHVKNTFESKILDQKLDTFLTTLRFRVLVENDLERLRQRTIKFDHVEINRKRISHRRHDESFKKEIFETNKKKSSKRVPKFEDEAKEKFDQKRRKKNLLLS
jgi:hypothetical protein